MVVQPGFAQANDLGMLRQLPQGRSKISGCLIRFTRMPADDRIHVGKPFRKLNRAPAALEVGANADNLGYPGIVRPRDNLRQLLGEIRIIKMRVSIVKTRHVIFSTAPSAVPVSLGPAMQSGSAS